MADELDEYRLEDIAQHPIGAEFFVPFVVRRLSQWNETEAVLRVRLIDVVQAGDVQRQLRLTWSREAVHVRHNAISQRTVTEWAACGIACVLAELYAGLRVTEIADDGDRFDYWVDDGVQEYGLEVSGTIEQDVELRRRRKITQLRSNPYGLDGYVAVVGFAARTVIFSFERFGDRIDGGGI